MNKFEQERSHVSHDIIINKFLYLLGSGMGEGRFGPEDRLFSALKGNVHDKETVLLATESWRKECSEEVKKFVLSVPTKYGFVPSAKWKKEIGKIRSALEYLDRFRLPPKPPDEDEAKAIAGKYWSACDELRRFVRDLSGKFGTYFIKWDPTLINSSQK